MDVGNIALVSIGLIYLSTLRIVDSLQCYDCTYNKLDSSIGILDTVLTAFEKISDEHCLLRNDEDREKMTIKNCPSPKKHHVYKCGKLEGKVKTTLVGQTVDYWTVEHGCIEVPEDDPETTDGCHTDLPANGIARDLLQKTFSGLDFGDIKFEGHTCYKQETVPVPSLQCAKCTFNDVETSNPIVNKAITTLKSLSSQNCKFENLEVDKYEVGLRNCPAPREGYITKCGTIAGEITAKFKFITNWTVKYKTTQRDCIEVPEEAYAYSDGCHSDLPGNGPGRALLMETFAGLNLGDIQFDGKACYDKAVDIRVASPQTSAAENVHISAAILILSWVVAAV